VKWLLNAYPWTFEAMKRESSAVLESGPPQDTCLCTSEEAQELGMVGVYRVDTVQ